jgi:hypothetical protein
MVDLTTQVKSGELVQNRKEIILDSENIYIELDPDKRELVLAYAQSTTEQEIDEAWAVCKEFGFSWVIEEYFDQDWARYVCLVGMEGAAA